jgi:hypothetical protein
VVEDKLMGARILKGKKKKLEKRELGGETRAERSRERELRLVTVHPL